MSALADARSVGLSQEETARNSLRRTPWLALAIALFVAADAVGSASSASSHGWLDQLRLAALSLPPVFRLMLSTNSFSLSAALGQLPWEIFFPIVLARVVIISLPRYYIGQDLAYVAKRRNGQAKSRLTKSAARFVRWLERASPRKLLLALFVSRLVLRWPPPLSWFLGFADPVPYLAAAKVPLRWVLAVELASATCFLVLLYALGPDLIGALRALV